MIRFALIVGIVSLLISTGLAQFNVELHGQFNTFQMEDLKELQKNLFIDPIVPMETVYSFPAYIGFKGSITYVLDNDLELGGALLYASTGGRVQYQDFSGSITGDQLTHAFTFGALGRKTLKKTEKIGFGVSGLAGVELTKLILDNSIKIGNTFAESNEKFNALGIVILPSLFFKYHFNEKIYLIADAGYHWTVYQDTYRWIGDNEAELFLDGSDDPLKPNWDGLRAGFGVGYFLNVR